ELHGLPDKYRAPIVLCDLQGKTRREAARQIGCPEGTIAGRLARGRSLLARRLARHGLVVSAAGLGPFLSATAASAAVPPTLLAPTVKAAALGAAGNAAVAGVISAKVAALTEGVLKAMFLTKVQTLASWVVACCFLTAGLGVLWHQARPAS